MQRTLVVADNKNREVDILLAQWCGTVLRGLSVGHFQVFVKETLPMAHGDRLFLVHAKHFGNVVAVQLKIAYDSKLIKAMK